MRASIASVRLIFSHLLDVMAPPRPSQRLVRSLTSEDIAAIVRAPGGALPYHDELVRALVWEVKYYADRHALSLCGEVLAELLLEAAGESIGVPLLIPVPMHRERRRERGHNQTELLCKAALSKHTPHTINYDPTILKRIRPTIQQQGLPEHRRRENVHNSMIVTRPEKVAGRVCIVVDDVATTGATLSEARRALRQAGAREVICVALAQS